MEKRTLRFSVSRLESYWHIFVLFYLSGGFFPLWRQMTRGDIDPSVGDPVLRYGLIAVYLISFFLFALRPPKDLKLLLKPNLLWLLIGYVFLTTTWAAMPMLSLRRAVSILFATIYGALLSLRYPPKKFFDLILAVLTIEIVLSFLVVMLLPEWGIMTDVNYGSWRGIFTAKNGLGRIASLAMCGYVVRLIKARPTNLFVYVTLTVIAMILLIFSKSATALVLTGFSIGLIFVLSFARKVRRDVLIFLLIITLLAMVLSTYIVYNYDLVLGLIGKEATFTGRIPLWKLLSEMAMEKPLLGYGYSGFWLGRNGPSSVVWENFVWQPPHAHNGYLDLWLELGFVGATLIILLMYKIIFSLFASLINARKEIEVKTLLFYLVFSLYILVYNSMESMFLESEVIKALFWVLIVYLLLLTTTPQTQKLIIENDIVNK